MTENAPISGEFAGRYVVADQVGRGGSSIVYRATDRVTGETVALKVLRDEFAQSIDAKRFLDEVKVSGALTHSAIVPIMAHGESEGRPYFVLPFMDEGTLRDRLRRERQLTVEDAVAIASSVASALEHAHGRKVIHRDVKPENILFREGKAFLADFGIAKALERILGETTTTTGVVRGTPAYMSPEQASGEKNLDARTDVYSLGCVVYEMLAGMPAFSGPTQQSVIAQRITHGPRPLAVYRPLVPDGVARVIDRALVPAPADRWQTVGEFAKALEGANANAGVARSTGGAVVVAGPRGSRARVAVGVVGVLAMLGYLAKDNISTLATRPLIATVVGIVPFDAPDPADSVWRNGLLDVLARNFDGAGPLRAVPPSVALAAWNRPIADTVTAAEFGRRVGAGIVLFGSLRRVGPDSVRLIATLFDVTNARRLRELSLTGSANRVLALAESLTDATLEELASIRPIASVVRRRERWLSSASLDVVKPFLQGEQFLRRNDYARAESSYTTALRADSGFALGWHRMRTVSRAQLGEASATSLDYALRAGRLNRGGLTQRDSLLIAADSFHAALPRRRNFYDEAADTLVRRRFAALAQASRIYPDDPEVWEQVGEARHHYGDRFATPPDSSLVAFEKAVALDPDYAPAYWHLVELTLGLRGVNPGLRLVRQFVRRIGQDARYTALEVILGDSVSTQGGLAKLLALSADDFQDMASLLRRSPAYGPFIGDALRLRASQATADSLARLVAAAWDTRFLAYFGRMREAWNRFTPATRNSASLDMINIALSGAVPPVFADSLFSAWAVGTDMERMVLSLAWLARRRDSLALKSTAARFDSLAARARSVAPSDSVAARAARLDVALATYGQTAVRMYRAILRGDTSAAIDAGARLREELCSWICSPQRLTYARLLMARGRAGDAARFLDAHPSLTVPYTVSEALWHVERTRAATLAGDSVTARREAAWVRSVWRNAEPASRAVFDSAVSPLRVRP